MIRKIAQLGAVMVIVGLLAWSVLAWRDRQAARQAGTAISAAIKDGWSPGEPPAPGTRQRLLRAAERVQAGEYADVAAGLDSNTDISTEQRAAAGRFFEQHDGLCERLQSAVSQAQTIERDGTDVRPLRDSLARAVIAAARGDQADVVLHLEIVEAMLPQIAAGESATAAAGPEAVAGLTHQLGPSYQLGRDLLTEGRTAVEKLLRRARRHFADEEYQQAAVLVRLAAQLSAVEPTGAAADSPPEWFLSLTPDEPIDAEQEAAVAAVGLCVSMAEVEPPSPPVKTLLRNAQRELTAQQPAAAFWWAGVALNALGMTDAQITAATQQPTANE